MKEWRTFDPDLQCQVDPGGIDDGDTLWPIPEQPTGHEPESNAVPDQRKLESCILNLGGDLQGNPGACHRGNE